MSATPWLYIGGPMGVLAVGIGTAIVRITGVLLLAVGAVAGQLVGGLLLDVLLPAGPTPVITTVAGIALTLVPVVVIALPRRRA
jgi:transporter family-2 protein